MERRRDQKLFVYCTKIYYLVSYRQPCTVPGTVQTDRVTDFAAYLCWDPNNFGRVGELLGISPRNDRDACIGVTI